MRVLVAGATGAVGRALLPELVRRGHEVAGLARRPESVAAFGAFPLAVDALDAGAVAQAFETFRPHAVVHQLTALPDAADLWQFDRAFAQTNLLRTEATDYLIAAARAVGVTRFVAQSFAGWPAARIGGPVKVESDPLDPDPPSEMRATLDAIRYLEAAVTAASDIGGVVLRYGSFYGPHTHLAPGTPFARQVCRRRLPVIGDGGGVWSFSHIDDVANATALAVERDIGGVFNVVDNEPAAVADWLPSLAAAMGAKTPWHLPQLLGRLFLPRHLMLLMTEARGASNERFKAAFGWHPRHPSWRVGFAELFA